MSKPKSTALCSTPGCQTLSKARGLCHKHYCKWKYHQPGEREKHEAIMQRPHNRYQFTKNRALKKNLNFNLELPEYTALLESGCYYCGMSLLSSHGVGLDRIDNSKGYERGNVLPCCGRCNQLRSNVFSVEETKVMIDALLKFGGVI